MDGRAAAGQDSGHVDNGEATGWPWGQADTPSHPLCVEGEETQLLENPAFNVNAALPPPRPDGRRLAPPPRGLPVINAERWSWLISFLLK